jgi:hypothetical protein
MTDCGTGVLQACPAAAEGKAALIEREGSPWE